MNIVDSSGWIEYLFGGANEAFFTPPIENTDRLLVPVICLYEVFKKVNAVANEARALQAVAQMKQGRIIDLTEDVALSAALISLKHRLPMAHSLLYATSCAQGATLWTQDEHFKGLERVQFKPARTTPRSLRRAPRRS